MKFLEMKDTDRNGILAPDLAGILELVERHVASFRNLEWRILELEATGDIGPQWDWPSISKAIETTEGGLSIDWVGLRSLSRRLTQTINATVVGRKKNAGLTSRGAESDWWRDCEVTVEFIDSSVCRVGAEDAILIAAIQASYRAVTVDL